ncbi:MAG: hypothetical protein H6R37_107 [Deltaproteobacteria bacterium]|nr:hypothetical protein [Deltaproteobacteria bacterium]
MIPKPSFLAERAEDPNFMALRPDERVPSEADFPQHARHPAAPTGARRMTDRSFLSVQRETTGMKSSRSRCTKDDKASRFLHTFTLLETIDGVDKMTQSCEVLSVKVDQESRKMSKVRFLGFGRLGVGERNFSFGNQDVCKGGIQLR